MRMVSDWCTVAFFFCFYSAFYLGLFKGRFCGLLGFFSPPTTQIQTHTHTTYICLSKPRMYDKLIVSIKWNEMIRPNKTSLPPRNDVNSKRIKKSGILINNRDGIWRIVFGCSVSLNLECRETKQREKKEFNLFAHSN